ncbi:hypothetical protein [Amycolatopsis speibonae]|uniref:Ig-like domain-containing protein n=1 Tax=Amycolatopsis speibonae TaxID=1450224 RepID=A0ABV7NX89_9PSEU
MRSVVPRLRNAFAIISTTGLLAVAGVAQASAASAAPVPIACESTAQNGSASANPHNPAEIDFWGTGTITCVNPEGALLINGTTTFDGTIPHAQCLGTVSSGRYHAKVDWADGKTTEGTFTDFSEVTAAGSSAVTISGVNDATSTRFGGYHATIVSTALGTCGSAGKTEAGTILYTP